MNISADQNKHQQESFFDAKKLEETNFILNLPGKLRADKRLKNKYRLQILIIEILNLSKATGYAYPSDKFLAEKMDVSVPQIQRDIKFLEECGYIKRITTQNGMKKERKIYVGDVFSNNFAQASRMMPGNHQGRCIEEYKSSNNIIEKEIPSNEGTKKPPPKKKFGEYGVVKLTDSQYRKALETYGEAKTHEYLQRMDYYCQSHGKKYKDYLATLHNWIAKDTSKTIEKQTKKKTGKGMICPQKKIQ